MPRHDCHPLSNYCAFRLASERRAETARRRDRARRPWWHAAFQIARPVVVRVPSRVHRRHQHTMGEVICAWFGKIPVVKRENGDAAPHQLCYIFFMRGEWWIDESIQSTPPSRVRGPLQNTIDGYDLALARFGPIQWLEWENWVVVNAEICDN